MGLLERVTDTGVIVPAGGRVNTAPEQIFANIEHSIRLGHPQVRPFPLNDQRVLLVGGGPSLEETKDELIDLYFKGGKIFTVNGAYHWCLKHNLRPSGQIVVDARTHNSRFVEPDVPQCTYLLASQCAPETWAKVEGREAVMIWHALGDGDEKIAELLNKFYLTRWYDAQGGTTAAVRALVLLRALGFMQFDVFGVDSCWGIKDGKAVHHSYDQPENDEDKHLAMKIGPADESSPGKEFWAAPWHLAQFENYLNLMHVMGDQFGRITIHGNGMLAYAMQDLSGAVKIEETGA